MIIGSAKRLEIGGRYLGIVDSEGYIHREQPYVVIRTATRAEWVADFVRDSGGEFPPMPPSSHTFYSVTTD